MPSAADSSFARSPERPARAASGVLRIAAVVAVLSGLLYGFSLAVIAGAEPSLRECFKLTSIELGLIVSNLDLGAALGAALAGSLCERFGRKKAIAVTALGFFLSAAVSACAGTVASLLAGRLLGGLSVGAFAVVPMYVAEISPPRRRGFLVTVVQLAIVVGILLAYVIGWLLVEGGASSWRLMFAMGLVPAAVLMGLAVLLPESPRWLSARGRTEEALQVLATVEGAPGASSAALEEIRRSLESEGGGWSELFSARLGRPLRIGILTAVLSVSVGINAVIFYGPMILVKGAGESPTAALQGSVFLGIANLIFSVVAMALVDRAGRRPLLLAGLGGMLVSMLLLGAAFRPEGGLAVFLSVLAFVAFYAASLGPVSWVLISEVFPTRVRGVAVSLCMVVMYLVDFVVTFLFPPMMERLGNKGFLVFAGVCAAGCVFVVAAVPETRGKSLEEIEALWRRAPDGGRL